MMREATRRVLRRAVLPLTAPIGSVRAVRADLPSVVLTFDDGPEPEGTERVLAALAAKNTSATFFVLLTRVDRFRGLLQEVVDAGHEIALHGLDHVRLTSLSTAEVLRRTRDGRARLEDAVQQDVRWFRPPYGAQSPATWAAVRRAGLQSVVWSCAAYDWVDAPVAALADRVLGSVAAGSVVLLHDGFAAGPDGATDGPPPTHDRGELCTSILDGLEERGLRAVSLGEASATGKAVRRAWFRD